MWVVGMGSALGREGRGMAVLMWGWRVRPGYVEALGTKSGADVVSEKGVEVAKTKYE
jgi:hypothetical protein